ncbi:MAG: hypothetical protein KAJ14_10665 [Candidatus Omnitrophica bacterium]|nr:hypothetical protein [Candidatus Omnitrophota bacterium]
MLFLLKKINIKSFFYFFIIFAIYISFYIKTHTMYGQDTFDFINWAEKGIALPLEFNCSRHIAYTSLTYLFFKIWVFFGWKQGAIVPLQLMSALFGAGGVLVFYNILKGLFSSKKFCFIGSLFFAFSYGYWFFSTEAVQTIPALFFRLVGILIFLRGPRQRLRIFFFIGLTHGLSTLFDSQGFWFLFIMIYGIYLFCKKNKKPELFKKISIYFSTAVLIIFIVYFIVSYFHFNYYSIQDFFKFTWGTGPIHNEGAGILDAGYTFLQSIMILDNRYLLQWQTAHIIINGIFIFLFVSIPGFLFFVRKNINEKEYNLLLLSLVWIIVFFTVYVYKEPLLLDFYIYLLPAFWFIFITVLWQIKEYSEKKNKGKQIFNISILVLLIVFIIHNLAYGIYPRSHIKNSGFYREFMFLERNAVDRSLVIVLTYDDIDPHYSIYYLNKTNGTFRNLIPINYEEEKDYNYESLLETVKQYDNLTIFILPGNIWKYDKQVEVVNIIKTVNLIHGEFQYIGLEQDFLNELNKEYEFIMVSNKGKANCSLYNLRKRGKFNYGDF